MPDILVHRREFPGKRLFEVVIGDLLRQQTDAIVNAANGCLVHGGGVALAISRAAGAAMDDDGLRIIRDQGAVPTGQAVVTVAGSLPFKGIIHAVGPQYGQGDEENLLISALLASFAIAHERGWASVAFPAVSAGIFAVPHVICARAYRRAVEEFYAAYPRTTVTLLRLVLVRGPLLDVVKNEMDSIG
jgi:O-acetyl-ADP-ribose deacetylase (regulator of RNase III)